MKIGDALKKMPELTGFSKLSDDAGKIDIHSLMCIRLKAISRFHRRAIWAPSSGHTWIRQTKNEFERMKRIPSFPI
jgi:hypothetical protein